MCSLWAAISEGAGEPPLDGDTIIAGRPGAWMTGRPHRDLWTKLRLLYLSEAWNAHRRLHLDGTPATPAAIASAIVASGSKLMRTEYIAASTPAAQLAGTCEAFMTGGNQRQSREEDNETPLAAFHSSWVASGLCYIDAGVLTSHWSRTHPVHLPGP